MTQVYIIHFSKPYHHARHYVGITSLPLQARFKRHIQGHGSKLTRAAVLGGVILESIFYIKAFKTMQEAREHEKLIKKHHNNITHCPKCAYSFKIKKNEDQRKRRKLKNENAR